MQTTNGTPADDERDPVTGESASQGYQPPQDAPIPLATPKPKIKTLGNPPAFSGRQKWS
ncbi:hypothetical protein [Xanthomonas citri]|uniref:hypothetical protein n=1 Tax=Xanthomonas citri TaxID=346 RepID=UPI000582E18A|nr:hypothetical protein [Xanthomonas citri]CEL49974.1 hypothetical protein XACJM35_3320016 [Xanthomonas citri pv. citri]